MDQYTGSIIRDNLSAPIQGHGSDPAKCLGTKAAGTVLKVGSGGNVDITGWVTVALYPTVSGQVEYNATATAIEPIYAGQRNVLLVHPGVTQIIPSVECIVCGM